MTLSLSTSARAPIRTLCALCFVCLCSGVLAGPPRQKPVKQERHGRDVLVIDGAWKFHTDPDDIGETQRWSKTVPEQATNVAVPALWTTQAAPNYAGTAWYWREFDAPAAWKGQTIRLRFEGAAETARVWVNGDRMGDVGGMSDHQDGVTPFEFDVTKSVHPGAKNLVAVRLTGNGKTGAGLWQGVQLLAHDEAYIADCFPQADALGHMTVDITFRNASKNSGDAILDARVVAADAATRDLRNTHQTLHLTPGDNRTMLLLSLSGRTVRRWSPETPTLYRLQLVFRQDKDLLDTQETSFGFRTLALQNGNLIINGVPVKPAAIGPRFDQPIVIATTDDEQTARNLLRRIKSGGANLIYLEAAPAALLRLADEEGLLVMEAPRQGLPAPARISELRALVLRDRAHPCIIGWNVGQADEPELQALRQLDPTRFLLTGPASAPKLVPPSQAISSSAALPAGFIMR